VRNYLPGAATQYLKTYCIPVSSMNSWSTLRSLARAIWLSLGHERLWLNIEVLLLWAHRTGTSYPWALPITKVTH